MRNSSGFTLPELVITLVVLGIMAAVVVPRFASQSDFDAFGVTQQSAAALRFAQKSAIAKRRHVCVTIAADSVALTYGTNFGDSCSALSCTANPANCLTNPATGQGYVLAAESGIAISAASFYFDGLGKPSASAPPSLSITGGSVAHTIYIEAETGYVYVP